MKPVSIFLIGGSPIMTLPLMIILYMNHCLMGATPIESILLTTPILFAVMFTAIYWGLSSIKDESAHFVLSGTMAAVALSILMDYFYNIYEVQFQLDQRGAMKAHILVGAYFMALLFTVYPGILKAF